MANLIAPNAREQLIADQIAQAIEQYLQPVASKYQQLWLQQLRELGREVHRVYLDIELTRRQGGDLSLFPHIQPITRPAASMETAFVDVLSRLGIQCDDLAPCVTGASTTLFNELTKKVEARRRLPCD